MENDLEVKKQYWQDVEQKVVPEGTYKDEFQEGELNFDMGSIAKSRRSFLQIMGFSFTALPLASCIRIPVKKALPYVQKSEQVVPGVANWYATFSPEEQLPLLVKTREGRPIKIEGNSDMSRAHGGTSAYTQASLLSLYDSSRFKGPSKKGQALTWEEVDFELFNKLNEVMAQGKEVIILVSPFSSPSRMRLIKLLQNNFKNLEVMAYQTHDLQAQLAVNEDAFGVRSHSQYDFSLADVIVSFGADFLGTQNEAVENTKGWSKRRDPASGKLSWHMQIESMMTLTGSNADERHTVSLNEQNEILLNVLSRIQQSKGRNLVSVGDTGKHGEIVTTIVKKLMSTQGRSIVLSGMEDKTAQWATLALNQLLGNIGQTVLVVENPFQMKGDAQAVSKLIEKINLGKVGAVFFWDTNPIYDSYAKDQLAASLSKVEHSISFSPAPDETSESCQWTLPANHFLESWGDYFLTPNIYGLMQPVIQPLFGSRMPEEFFLKWMKLGKDYHGFLQETARRDFLSFGQTWEDTLHKGGVETNKKFTSMNLADQKISSTLEKTKTPGELTLLLYQKLNMRRGKEANNPWLQELPDPITKVTWENYVLVGPTLAKKHGLKTGDEVSVSTSKGSVRLPCVVQPGVHSSIIAVAVGHGRSVCGKVGKGVGQNVSHLTDVIDGLPLQTIKVDSFTKTGAHREMAQTQTHHSMEGRPIVKETTLNKFLKNPKSGNEDGIKLISLWSEHDKSGEQWGMIIDLNKCTGCSGCIVSCSAENNVPVVGREEVMLRREMHWLRLDRYYQGDDENPEVVHQPIMCQHCENAPCETVCPVIATARSSDGLNQQVYNRCVGTRYCANNCPYKVRRFNWFDYPHTDPVERMVLNPDVAVRTRGVMEKCSMCIQRIQEGKLIAKKEGRAVADGDIMPACQQSCPADAITFGNLNDAKSKIVEKIKSARNYRLLEELNIGPRVSYLTKVRNKE